VSVGKYEGRETNNVDALVAADTPRTGAKRTGGAKKETGKKAADKKKRTFK
jgi:hypothetical protein